MEASALWLLPAALPMCNGLGRGHASFPAAALNFDDDCSHLRDPTANAKEGILAQAISRIL